MKAGVGFQKVTDDINQISGAVIDASIQVHKRLGPGLLESSYRLCLVHELTKRGFAVKQELALPIIYDELKLDSGYRIDLLVADTVVVELKAVDDLLAIHQAQLLSYLKHSGKRVGLLINFNSVLLKDGIRRVVNG
jgi:GxxExxY protein